MSIQSILAPAGAGKPKTGLELRAAAREVTRQFEEFFAREMVKSFRETSVVGEGGGLFGEGVGSDTYTEWFDEHMAHHVSHNGRVGISDVLMRDLERYNQIPTADQAQAEVEQRKEALDAVA